MAHTVAELVFIPFPGLGHIKSAIEIAKLLVNRDQNLSITVLIINPPSLSSGSAMTTYYDSLAKHITYRLSFIEIPEDEIPPMSNLISPVTFFTGYINSHCKYVRNVVANMISQSQPGRVAGFVIDIICSGMIDVANEFNLPTYLFFISNAAYLGFEYYIQQTVCDDQKQDFIELRNSDTEITISGFVKPVPTTVFPSVIRTREDLDYCLWSTRKLRQVKGIMVNTFLELETHAIKSLSADTGIPLYPVGPLLSLEGGGDDKDIIGWLDSQPLSSVVFLCFGSMGSFDESQVKEIAHALEKSGLRFLWSLRRLPSDQISSTFPSEYENPGEDLPHRFLERTAGVGKVVGWAPQVTVLAHPAVGGFVSHCGWNSLLESLWFGVPVATWPLYAEQQLNAFYMVVELGLAVEIKLDSKKEWINPKAADTVLITADEIESGIRRLMEDNKVRTKVKEMSMKSREAMEEGGSSYASVGCFIHDLIKNMS